MFNFATWSPPLPSRFIQHTPVQDDKLDLPNIFIPSSSVSLDCMIFRDSHIMLKIFPVILFLNSHDFTPLFLYLPHFSYNYSTPKIKTHLHKKLKTEWVSMYASLSSWIRKPWCSQIIKETLLRSQNCLLYTHTFTKSLNRFRRATAGHWPPHCIAHATSLAGASSSSYSCFAKGWPCALLWHHQ